MCKRKVKGIEGMHSSEAACHVSVFASWCAFLFLHVWRALSSCYGHGSVAKEKPLPATDFFSAPSLLCNSNHVT